MWILQPRTEKLRNVLYDLEKKHSLTDEEEQALFIADYIIQLHRKETESAIKGSIKGVQQLNAFGKWLTRFCKINEEVK